MGRRVDTPKHPVREGSTGFKGARKSHALVMMRVAPVPMFKATLPSLPLAHPLERGALRSAAGWSMAIAVAGCIAGLVRLLPWLLDPNVPWRVAVPFARSVAEVVLEAALLVGWPLGWSLAAYRFADRGEARVLMLLGESPWRTAIALWRSALPFVLALGVVSVAGARDAGAPGRVAQQLVTEGRRSCAAAAEPSTFAVPFVAATWLCAPGHAPRLYGHGPGGLAAASFTAKDAIISGDMRRIELDDARLELPLKAFPVDVHVDTLVLRGMSPWAHASNVPPWFRAWIVVAAAALAALVGLQAGLRRLARGPIAAVAVGVAGPLAALGLMRAMERADTPLGGYLLLPLFAATVPAAVAIGVRRFARLP